MKGFFQFLRERIFRMRLKRAIREAETLRRMTGKKHLVVRWKNKPVVVSKQRLKLAISRKELRCNIHQAEEMALYITH